MSGLLHSREMFPVPSIRSSRRLLSSRDHSSVLINSTSARYSSLGSSEWLYEISVAEAVHARSPLVGTSLSSSRIAFMTLLFPAPVTPLPC